MRIYRQFQHLKSLQRAGRGHDISGVRGTKPGGTAVVCWACPNPDVNLPAGWREVDRDQE